MSKEKLLAQGNASKNSVYSVRSGRMIKRLKLTSSLTLVSVVAAVNFAAADSLQLSGNIDGATNTGFIVTNDSRFTNTSGNVTVGNLNEQSLVHNFDTVGGAGSGGGAGLGGAFFVDQGGVLTVINTDFKSNRAEGGQGGSTPALRFYDNALNIAGARADMLAVTATSSTPTQIVKNGDGSYSISTVSVGSEALPLLKTGAELTFGSVSGASTSIDGIVSSDRLIRFDAPVVVGSSDINSIGKVVTDNTQTVTQAGFTLADSRTIRFDRVAPDEGELTTDIAGLSDVTVGSVVVVGSDVVTVKSLNYNNSGFLESVTLSDAVAVSSSTQQIDFLPKLDFTAANFTRGADNQYTILDDSKTFSAGMVVSWDEGGETKTATITNVADNTITLDRPIAAGVSGFTAIKNPVVGAESIQIANADALFKQGDVVYLPDADGAIAYVGTVSSISSDGTVVFNRVSGTTTNIADLYVDGVGLAVRKPAAVVSGDNRTITVAVDPNGSVEAGMTISGSGFAEGTTVDSVTEQNGFWVISLSDAIIAADEVGYFKIASPLVKGGSMNGLTPFENTEGENGSNGSSILYSVSALSDGEGVDGNNGQSALDPNNGTGFDGGDGGNGSDGMNVNPGLIYDLTSASYGFAAAINGVVAAGIDLAGAISPDILITITGGVTAPDPVEIGAKQAGLAFAIADLVFATSDLGIVIADQVLWNRALADGYVGRGGAGGDGGEGSGGADFFGGGAGGNGGDGGDGGADTTHGGDAGSGGRGGDGGFGAGGGQGGAGGTGGANGFAYDGDPGDGGYAGFGAGEGANGNGMFGGGGSGLGGSIFVREGGSLTIQGNSLFELNYVAGGSTTSQGGEAGMSAGTDLFMMKGASVRLEPGLNNEIRFEGDIADDSLATNDGFMNAAGDGSDITIAGNGGLVTFNGENTYSGHTILEGATLTALMGTGVNDASTLRFNGVGVGGSAWTAGTLSLGTTGTFLLQEDYNRRAGTDPQETMWTGSGGFASGVEAGSIVNLGELDAETKRGQDLVWGSDGFFVNAGTGRGIYGTLTFGSELSLGSVEFTNDVNLAGNDARIAVYGGGENVGYDAALSAIVSGDWVNGTLTFGDGSTGTLYNGLLFLTGQNALSQVIAQGGSLSTFSIEPGSSYGKLLSTTGDLFVYPGASVSLFGTEAGRNAYNTLGTLFLAGETSFTGDFENTGYVNVDNGTDVSSLGFPGDYGSTQTVGSLNIGHNLVNGAESVVDGETVRIGQMVHSGEVVVGNDLVNEGVWTGSASVAVTHDVTNRGNFSLAADMTVGGNLGNSGLVEQAGDVVVAGAIQNTGFWRVSDGNAIVADTLVGNGSFCLSDGDAGSLVCDETEASGQDLALTVRSSSTFDGVFAGNGELQKLGNGNLTLTNVQTFAGGLVIDEGAVTLASTSGLNDNLDVTVAQNSVFTTNAADTFGTLTNSGIANINANQTVRSASVDGGTLNLNANLTTTEGAFNVSDVEGRDGLVVVSDDFTIAAAGGLTGNGNIEIADNTAFTLQQGANSAFTGNVLGTAGASNTTFNLTDGGNLTLAGNTNQMNVSNLNIVNGQLSLDGSELLVDTIAVDVSSLGSLALIDDSDEDVVNVETIYSLSGVGKIFLGRNTLNIANGGDFEGEVMGTGAVNVADGSFTINSNLTSNDGTLNISNATGTTINHGATVSMNTVNVNQGARLNVVGTGGASSGNQTVVQTNGLVVQTASTLHMGPGSYSAGAENFSLIDATSVLINGAFTGTGTVNSSTVSVTGVNASQVATVRPGDSPGIQVFNSDLTTFGDNSELLMEVTDYLAGVGVGYDQVQFQAGGKVVIEGTAKLSISDWGTVNADNDNLGNLVQFAEFDPLAITGKFDSVSYTGVNPNIAVNLATGTMVGLGSVTLADAATNENQAAMLAGMLVSTDGDVDQYYGGTFIQDLTANWSSSDDVFAKASPEVYAGLGASAQSAALNSVPNWANGLVGQEGTYFDVTRDTFASEQSNADHFGFGVDVTNTTAGFVRTVSDATLMFSMGTVSSDLQSDLLTGSGSGMNLGVTAVGALAGTDGAFWTAGLRHASLSMDGKRLANGGLVTFEGVDASATQFNMGVEVQKSNAASDFALRANLVWGNTTSDAFDEIAGSANPLDAMHVDAVSVDYARFDLGLKVGTTVQSGSHIFASLDASIPMNDAMVQVGGSYDGGQAAFNVDSMGLNAANYSLSVGVQHPISENGVLSFELGAGNDWNNDTVATGAISAQFNF